MLKPEATKTVAEVHNRSKKIKLVHKCKKCQIETRQEDQVCVLCKAGINQLYKDLMDSLRRDREDDLLMRLQMMEAHHKPAYEKRDDMRHDLPYTVVEYFIDTGVKYKSFKPKKLEIGFITNVSDSGLCLFASRKFRAGQKIVIKSDLFTSFLRTVARWTEKFDDVFYQTGLEFIE